MEAGEIHNNYRKVLFLIYSWVDIVPSLKNYRSAILAFRIMKFLVMEISSFMGKIDLGTIYQSNNQNGTQSERSLYSLVRCLIGLIACFSRCRFAIFSRILRRETQFALKEED